MKMTINKHWKFHLGDVPDAWQKDFDDCEWDAVTLPHDWAVSRPFSEEHSSGTGYLPGGIGWYRLSFVLPEEDRGKKIWICFDGVYKNSQVWCNGYYLGKRPYGYTAFRHDISDFAAFGSTENVITVKVSHEDIADSRWFTGSGITRQVHLEIQEKVYFGQYGVFFTTPECSTDETTVKVNCTIVNELTESSDVTVINRLISPDGDEAASMTTELSILPGSTEVITQTGVFPKLNIWSVNQPNLYTLKSSMIIDGVEVNSQNQKVGIRSFRFDPDKGFFLNGNLMKLKGVNVHHDAGCLGAAVPKNVWERRLIKLKAMGCNAIRMSHNPHSPQLYDLCDEMGFLVIDEAFDEWEGPKNKWSTGHNVYPPKHYGYAEDFPQWHDIDLRTMVRRDRNHPSVILWSIGNEIDYPNDPYAHPIFAKAVGNNDANKPEQERIYNPNRPNMERLAVLANRLIRIVKEEDDTRPATTAVSFPELSTHIGFIDSLDVVGYNYKEQYYVGDHERFPQKSFLGSEAIHSIEAWKAVTNNEFISGQFLWTGIDFLGETKGWPEHGSKAGILTMAGFEKSSYGFRRALWVDYPVISLVSARAEESENTRYDRNDKFERYWNYRPGEDILVRCYTNQPSVEFFLNGDSLGVKQLDNEKGYIELPVIFAEGVLSAKAQGVEAVLETVSAPCGIRLTPIETTLVSDGEAVAQIEVEVIDSKGRTVITDSSMLTVNVDGSASLLGIENGNIADNTPYSANYRRTHLGRAIIYVRASETEGETTVTVEGSLIGKAAVTIEVTGK